MKSLLLAAGLALVSIGISHSQTATSDPAPDYPGRPVRQIVPFPPGGGVDIVTRIVGAKWSEVLGQPILVENRAGAGGNLGADIAAKAAPDGYTLFTCQVASHGVSPAVYNKLPYDHIRDFAPISLIGKTPNVLVVHPSVPLTVNVMSRACSMRVPTVPRRGAAWSQRSCRDRQKARGFSKASLLFLASNFLQ